MALGLYEDDDPIFKTSEQARAQLPVYGGVNKADQPAAPARGLQPEPAALYEPPTPAAPAPAAPAGVRPELLQQGYEPVTLGTASADSAMPTSRIRPELLQQGYEPVTLAPLPSDKGNFRRGLETSWEQLKQTGAGTAALVGDTFGLEGLKNWGLEKYQSLDQNVQALSSDNDDIYKALSKEGSFTDWLGYAAGYTVGQAGQLVLGGGVGGVVGKMLLQKGAQKLAAGMIEKKVGELAAEQLIAKGVGEAAAKEQAAQMIAQNAIPEALKAKAVGYTAQMIGAGIAATGMNASAELGSIYGSAQEEAAKTGVPPSLAKIWASGIGAAAIDTFTDMGAVGRVLHGVGHGSNMLARVAKAGTAQALKEAGTEGIQTLMERWGAGQSLNDAAAWHDYLNSMAMGTVGGGGAGVMAGVTGRSAAAQKAREEGTPQAPGTDIGEEDLPDVTLGRNAQTPLGLGYTPQARGLHPTVPTEAASTADLEAENDARWERRADAERQRQLYGHLPDKDAANVAAADAVAARISDDAKKGDVPSVKKGLQELVGNAQSALDSIHARPDIYTTLGQVQAALDDLASKHTSGQKATGLTQDATPPADAVAAAPAPAATPAPVATTPDATAAAPAVATAAAQDTTTVEPQSDLNAQIAAMMDPANPKDSVFVAKGTPLPDPLPAGLARVYKPEGVYLTRNPEKARGIAGPQPLTDQQRADFLGIPEGKAATAAQTPAPVAVSAKDAAGNVVAQAATTPAGPNVAAVADQTPSGGSTEVTSIPAALDERAQKVADEQNLATAAAPVATATSATSDTATATPSTEVPVATEAPGATKAKKTSKAKEAAAKAATTEAAAALVEPKPAASEPSAEEQALAAKRAPLVAKINEDTRQWNELVEQFKAANEDGKATLRTMMDPLKARLDKASRALLVLDQKAMTLAHGRQRTAEATATYGPMPVGTKIGLIGYEKADDIYYEKVAADRWQRVWNGERNEIFKTDAQMEGARVIGGIGDAVQKPGAASVLQPAPTGDGKAGRQRGRVESEKSGEEAATKGQAGAAKTGTEPVTATPAVEPTVVIEGLDHNEEPTTLKLWADGGKVTRAELHYGDGSTLLVATKSKDSVASVLKRVEDEFTPLQQKQAEPEAEAKSKQNTKDQSIAALGRQVRQSGRKTTKRGIAENATRAERQAFVNDHLAPDWGTPHTVTLVDTPPKHDAMVRILHALLGQNIQFYSPASLEMDRATQGFKVPGDPDTIYVSVNSQEPAAFVFGHEIGHNIRELRPKLWSAFMQEVRGLVDQKAFDKYLHNLKVTLEQEAKKRGESQPTLRDIGSTAIDETSADALGTAFMDPKFWELLHKSVSDEKKPVVIRMMEEVAALLKQLLQAIHQKIADPNVTPKVKAEQNAMFKDIRALHRSVRDLLIDFREQEIGAKPLSSKELEAEAAQYYEQKMEPDESEGHYPWAKLSRQGRDYWIEMYDLFRDGDIDEGELLREFENTNRAERSSKISEAQSGAAARSEAYAEAQNIWDEKLAGKGDPEFDDLPAAHKNYFIRAVYDNAHGKDITPTAAFDQIKDWIKQGEAGLSEEQKRIDKITKAQAKEDAAKAAAAARVEKEAAAQKERRAALQALVEKEMPAITERLQNLSAREQEVVAAYFNAPRYNEKIAKRLSLKVAEVLVDPKVLVRALPDTIRPVIRRIVGGVKYSRVALGMEPAFSQAERSEALEEALQRVSYSRTEPRITGTGKIIGAPPGKNTPRDRAQLVQKLTRLMTDPFAVYAKSHTWYEDSGKEIARLTQGDPALQEKLIRMIAFYSAGSAVGPNTAFSVRATLQAIRGEKIESGMYPNVQSPGAQKVLNAKEMDDSLPGVDNKLMNFYRNLKDATTGQNNYDDASTLDRWMMRIFGYKYRGDQPVGGAAAMSTPQYEYGKDIMHRVADAWEKKTGERLLPRQVQAVLWTYVKNHEALQDLHDTKQAHINAEKLFNHMAENPRVSAADREQFAQWADESHRKVDLHQNKIDTFQPKSINYQHYLDRATARVLYEVRPSTKLDVMPFAHKLGRDDLREFSNMVRALFNDPQTGRDMLMQKVGLPLNYTTTSSVGSWDGAVSPNFVGYATQEMVPSSKKDDPHAGTLDPRRVNVYADALGYILRQDAVLTFRPDKDGKSAGVSVTMPNLPEGVDERLYQRIRATLPGVEFTRDGDEVFFVNVAEDKAGKLLIDNDHFVATIRQAVDTLVADEQLPLATTPFRTDAKLHENDWRKNPNGEGYAQRLGEAGRSDLLAWLDSKRREIDGLAAGYAVQRGDRVQYSRTTEAAGEQATPAGLQQSDRLRRSVRLLDVTSGSHPRLDPIRGLPQEVEVDGQKVRFGPFAPALRAAEAYATRIGLPSQRPDYVKLNPALSQRVATAFDQMTHAPDDPVVKASYAALAEETLAQWRAVKATGLKVEFMQPGSDPYGNPRNALRDITDNNHLWVYPTDAGFGSSDLNVADNPLLAQSGEMISGQPARINDLFRIVHDYFGHAKEGIGFRAEGEDNAWRQHATMFSDAALPALTTETRGQNSWVNFGPYAEQNRTASGADTVYADQKVGLLPEWTYAAARDPVEAQMQQARVQYSRKDMLNPVEVYALQGDRIVGMATFNVPNQQWTVYKAAPGGDIRQDYTEHAAADTADALNQMRDKGVRLVKRKESPLLRGHTDVWGRGPDALLQVDPTPTKADNWFTKSVDRALDATGLRGKGPDWRRKLTRNLQDAHIDVLAAQKDITSKGGNITAANNVYQKIALYSGATGEALDKFARKYAEPLEKALIAALQKGATMKDVERFLIAQHAEERNRNIEQKTLGKRKDGSGVSDVEARSRLRFYSGTPYHAELQNIGHIADAISAFKVDLMEKSGLISADTATGLRQYQHYRPLKGLDPDDTEHITQGLGIGTGFSGKGTLLKHALGRDTEAQHTISHMLLDAEAKIVRAGRNEVALAQAQLAEDFPDPKFWTVSEMKTRQDFDPETGTIRYRTDNDFTNPNRMVAYKNGLPIHIDLKDDSYAQAMTNSAAAGHSGVLEGFRRWNRYLAMMMTSLNPEWGIVNAARDAQTTYFNIASDPNLPPGMAKTVMKELLALKGHKDIYKAITDPQNASGLGQWYEELASLGGITRFVSLNNLETRAKQLATLEERVTAGGIKSKLHGYYDNSLAQKTLQWLDDANATVEAAPRVAAYKVLRNAGWSKEDAADYAKNLTVNFNRKGSNQWASAMYLFFNPAVQGTARLYQALKTPQGKMVATSLFGLGFVAALTGNSGGDDDKNGIPDYQQLSDYDRSTNIILWPHGPKVPLPYGWNAFYAMGNFLGDTFFGRSPMAAAWSGIKSAQGAFNPLGSGDSKTAAGWFLKSIMPTAIDPVLELAMNENRYGSQIARTQDTRFGPKQPASQMGGMSATQASKAVTSGVNALTGGSAAKAGLVDVNPDVIDYLMGQFLPGVATQAARSVSTVGKLASGEPTETKEYPGVRRVVAEPNKGMVYQKLQDAKAELGEYLNIQKNGSVVDRQELAKEHPGWAGVAASFTVYGKQVGDLQKRKAAIIDGKLKVPDATTEKNRIDTRVLELENKMLNTYNTTATRWQ